MIIKHLNCCGLKEIHGISSYGDPAKCMDDLLSTTAPPPLGDHQESLFYSSFGYPDPVPVTAAYLIFTQARRSMLPRYGEKLAVFIRENNLGTVTESPERVNPNSTNPLTVFLWAPDYEALKRWRADRKLK